MIKKMLNLLTRINWRWKRKNKKVLDYFWIQTEDLNDLYKIIAREYLYAAFSVSMFVLGNKRIIHNGLLSIKQRDINKLSEDQYFAFYSTILLIFYSLYVERGDYNSGNVFESFSLILKSKIEPIFPNEGLNDKQRIENIINKGLKEIFKYLEFHYSEPLLFFAMLGIILKEFIDATKRITEKVKMT
jgi:hypothetical protein